MKLKDFFYFTFFIESIGKIYEHEEFPGGEATGSRQLHVLPWKGGWNLPSV